MTDIKKYFIRFGLVLMIALPILFYAQGETALRIITYKICLVAVAIGLCELIWSVFYKPVYGASVANKASPFSISTLHNYIHSRYSQPKIKDILIDWDNARIFFEKIWQ